VRILLGLLLISTLVAGAGALWLHDQLRSAERDRLTLSEQLSTTRAQRQDAIEQRAAAERERLIAERQRQDALQQRSAAERERLSAEQQRKEALAQRTVAERERLNADEQRREAVQQHALADLERRNADEQRQAAVQQRTVADRLRLLSVAQSLAVEVPLVLQRGDHVLGALMAVQAYRFAVENGGSYRDADIFESLRRAHFALVPEGRVLLGHEDEVRSVAFLSAEQIASSGDDGTLRLWDVAEASEDTILVRTSQRLQALAFDDQRRHLAVGGSAGHLSLWSFPFRSADQLTQSTEGRGVSSVAFTETGDLAAGFLDGGVMRWVPDGQALTAPATVSTEAHAQPIDSFGRTLVWARLDGGLSLWERKEHGSEAAVLGAELGYVTALTVCPVAQRLAAGFQSGDIALWDLRDLDTPPAMLVGHASQVTSLNVGTDQILASGSLDNTVRLWDVYEPDQSPITIDHGAWVWSVDLSPNGELVASAGADRAVRLWPTVSATLTGALCGAVHRNLDDNEWLEFIGPDIPYRTTCDHLPAPEPADAPLD
jgi:WD40 repeat protein